MIEKLTSKNHRVFIFLFAVTLFAYGNILFGNFVFDDNTFIEHNTQIRSLSNVDAIYSSSTTAGSGLLNDNFYRPNQQFIYALIYSMFGLSPSVFHLVVILFHILNGFLIFILFSKLGISRRISLVGSLLFLLHPILTEAVSYISGLSDPLVTSTILLTLLVFLKALYPYPQAWVPKPKLAPYIGGGALKFLKGGGGKKYLQWLLLGAAVFTVGLLSKENQVISLGLIFIIFIFKYKKGEIKNIFRPVIFMGILSIISALYVYFRLTALNFTGVIGLTSEVNAYTQNLWVRLVTVIHILPEYFKMIVFPWHLYYEKPYVAYYSLWNVQSIFSLMAIVCGFVLAMISIIKRKGEIFLGLSWFIIALIPVSGIIPVNAMYLEHWLYLPIIGIIFCFCSLFEELSDNQKRIAFYFLIMILILFTIRIMMRNAEWGDPIKFYENEIKYTQSSARIYNNLAMEKADRGDCDSAIPNYQKAISLNDSYPQTHHNLARCLEHMGKNQEAVGEYLKALYIQPNFLYSINGMYKLLYALHDKRSQNFLELETRIENNQNVTREDILNAAK